MALMQAHTVQWHGKPGNKSLLTLSIQDRGGKQSSLRGVGKLDHFLIAHTKIKWIKKLVRPETVNLLGENRATSFWKYLFKRGKQKKK